MSDNTPIKEEKFERKRTLFSKLRAKMKTAGFTYTDDESEEHPSAVGRKRKMQGNKNAEKAEVNVKIGWIHAGKNVRLRTGGGIRMVKTIKTACAKELIDTATEKFFPCGKSQRGNVEDFDFSIVDFEKKPVPEDLTVGEFRKNSGVSLLTFYLVTTTKDSSTDDLPEIDISSEEEKTTDLNNTDTSQAMSNKLNVTVENPTDSLSETLSLTDVFDEEFILPTLTGTLSEEIAIVSDGSLLWTDDTNNNSLLDVDINPIMIRIKRTDIVNNLIFAFKNPNIVDTPVKFELVDERGSDEKGVSREVYTIFWNEFFISKAEGERYKVPVVGLNRKWQKEEWFAVARVLAKGFLDHDIFPLKFAPAFVAMFVVGADAVTPEILFDSIVGYMSRADADIVNKAINGTLDEEDSDIFIDILSGLDCHTVPQKDNVKPCILQLAHSKLIQEPKYISDCFSLAIKYLSHKLRSLDDILRMYEDQKPTARKIIKLFKANPSTESEKKSLTFLEKFIRAQNPDNLVRLLHFMTGADTLCVQAIDIEFSGISGAARRPIAHCCGPVLELPSTYTSYVDFRSEFDCVISHDVNYLMDIA